MFKQLLKLLFPVNSFMLNFDPLTIAAVTVGSGLLSGLFGSDESDQEKAIKSILDKLDANENFFKSTPFSKEELFQTIMPAIQKTQIGAADVAAGRLGAAVGETANVASGQGKMDYYLQTLAPIIAQGQQNAASTYQNFMQLWNQMDAQAKNRFMESLNMQLGASNGLNNMSNTEQFFTNFLSGAQLGMTGYGNIMQGSALSKQANALTDIAGNMQFWYNQPTGDPT